MQGDGLVVVGFFGTLFGAAVALWRCIRMIKTDVQRWDFNSTVLLVMSVGNFGEKQRDLWRPSAGYSAEEADLIVRINP